MSSARIVRRGSVVYVVVVTALSSLTVGMLTAVALQGQMKGMAILAYVASLAAWVILLVASVRSALTR